MTLRNCVVDRGVEGKQRELNFFTIFGIVVKIWTLRKNYGWS